MYLDKWSWFFDTDKAWDNWRFESRDLASLETVLNINQIHGLILTKTPLNCPKTCLNKTQETKNMFKQNSGNYHIFLEFSLKYIKLSNYNIKVCNKTVTDVGPRFLAKLQQKLSVQRWFHHTQSVTCIITAGERLDIKQCVYITIGDRSNIKDMSI